jgi:small GTP-binding protein
MSVISKKICMVGDYGVGKTSLVRQYLDRQFSDHYLSTIGVKISRKLLAAGQMLGQNQMSEMKGVTPEFITTDLITTDLQLMIWDVEGQTQFQAIAPHYLEGSMGAVIVADLNRLDSIDHIGGHLDLLAAVNGTNLPCAIALNKVDTLTQPVMISGAIAELYTYPQVIGIYQTSAKTAVGVDDLFLKLGQQLLHHHFVPKTTL